MIVQLVKIDLRASGHIPKSVQNWQGGGRSAERWANLATAWSDTTDDKIGMWKYVHKNTVLYVWHAGFFNVKTWSMMSVLAYAAFVAYSANPSSRYPYLHPANI